MLVFFIIIFVLVVVVLSYAGVKRKNRSKPSNDPQRGLEFNVTMPRTPKTEVEEKQMAELVKKYPKWYGEANTVGQCYQAERLNPLPDNREEIVAYKSDRYAELFGRGKDCSYFPGYGKIHNRVFDVWYRSTHSKEKQGVVEYKDVGNADYSPPFFADKLTNGIFIGNELTGRTQGYLKLFNVHDDANMRTWYAGLKSIEFTGIITTREVG
jgi:hypothetical protein